MRRVFVFLAAAALGAWLMPPRPALAAPPGSGAVAIPDISIAGPGCTGRSPASCAGDSLRRPRFDLTPFKEMARHANCADDRNALFLIDSEFVFWDRRQRACLDNNSQQVLFGSTVANPLCEQRVTIAGLIFACADPTHVSLFMTIIANLDEPDLGLGQTHVVDPIPL